ncbi:hypothetical protein ROHU_028510 [Labeo rohita]|uniref:Uncharacterized protein n=1 Tax=Labeo rohita TaxID=84645 RepID=A0A498MBI7_LABRO|nr:hypothetical protein ROHU_028510 [Labeo rohita]
MRCGRDSFMLDSFVGKRAAFMQHCGSIPPVPPESHLDVQSLRHIKAPVLKNGSERRTKSTRSRTADDWHFVFLLCTESMRSR